YHLTIIAARPAYRMTSPGQGNDPVDDINETCGVLRPHMFADSVWGLIGHAFDDLIQCIRHIVGNPFRPYRAPPCWPATVVKLAEALYAGGDCSFALRDSLLEAGHAELADHFKEKDHPKGCWVVDLLLGKE